MEELLQEKQDQLIEEYLPAPEPVTTTSVEVNPYTTDLIIIVVGIVVLGSAYKLWLKYGKK